MSEVVLLLPNTDSLRQADDYVRDYYFYQILTAFNKLTIMSEIVLHLPNTDSLQQADDYVRGCTTSKKILTAFNKLTIMSEVAHDNYKRIKLSTYFYIYRLAFDKEIAALTISTETLKLMAVAVGFKFQ